ncbi:hypothetical protein [Aeromonas sp. FDAARGOS 1402]|uniref:hypothetical protein n=1 Tax=Aeromonas sp. FDAARGOS 1402 TaxID=2778051 RepID=UPI0020B33D9F|nr:hypothetical protein [Aeromonas sp. FDAARGOS 1402]
MDLLLILTYTALCIGIFKIFKIPLNKWTVPTAVLGGVIIIGTLIMLMNYNHPIPSWLATIMSPPRGRAPGREGACHRRPRSKPNQPGQEKGMCCFASTLSPSRRKGTARPEARLASQPDFLKAPGRPPCDPAQRSGQGSRPRRLRRRGSANSATLDVTQAQRGDIIAQIDLQKATAQ